MTDAEGALEPPVESRGRGGSSLLLTLMSAGFAAAAAAGVFLGIARDRHAATIVESIIIACFAAIVAAFWQPGSYTPSIREVIEEQQEAAKALRIAEDELSREDQLTLGALWRVTEARISLYHKQARTQSARAFNFALIASAIGFLLLFAFAILAETSTSDTIAIVAGALGTVTAAFGGYIGRTFIKVQEISSTHLKDYFEQPVEFSRFLAAERLIVGSDVSEDHKLVLLSTLVTSIVSSAAPQSTKVGSKELP